MFQNETPNTAVLLSHWAQLKECTSCVSHEKPWENAYMQYWDLKPCKVKCSIFLPFFGNTKEAQSYWDRNMNQGQLTHSQLQDSLTGTVGITETGFSIQMGERVGQPDSPACLETDRLPTAVRTKGMKMTTLPKLATDETCTAEWTWYTSPICLCVQALHYLWQRSPYTTLLTYSLTFISRNILLQLSFWVRFWTCSSIHQLDWPLNVPYSPLFITQNVPQGHKSNLMSVNFFSKVKQSI